MSFSRRVGLQTCAWLSPWVHHRSALLRRVDAQRCRGRHVDSATTAAHRHVHERPFQELPEDLSQNEAYSGARDALLQLNIMIRRGMEPDALMYTSLIATMGRAGLEWQAYKLFSRMIEQNIQPLPETYVALRDATSKQRATLREQIQTKIEEAVQSFPEELAEAERERRRAEDRRCIAKFDEYMRGVLPAPTVPPSSSLAVPSEGQVEPFFSTTADASSDRTSTLSSGGDQSQPPPSSCGKSIASMHIRNPTDVWQTTRMAQEQRGRAELTARGEEATDLRVALERMDEEELRIYLAAQRQHRHGTKAELIDRVLKTVSANTIRAMLDRRRHYFRSVEQLLAADMRQLTMAGPLDPSAETAAPAPARSELRQDGTMETSEKEALKPDVLYTPWGILRKPQRDHVEKGPVSRNMERLERVRLSEPELLLVRQKAETNDLDEVPESLLRRYAYQFQLRWRRKEAALSLLTAVQWHATTCFASALQGGEDDPLRGSSPESPAPTPAIRLQKEEEGMQKTLASYEAFRVIAQRTNNLQVVDSKEINHHLRRVRRDAVQQERKVENALRRERHIMEAAGLAASAKSFTSPPPLLDDTEGRVLGVGERTSSEDDIQAALPASSPTTLSSLVTVDAPGDEEEEAGETTAAAGELPPWALFEEEDEFNISSGRFGNPEEGRFRELSDSNMRVLPVRAAQSRWTVDRHLLPSSLKDIVHEVEVEQQRRHDAVEREYERRLHYTKYRKWDNMISKAQERRSRMREEAEAEGKAWKPLPAKQRLSQLLRKGSDRQKLSAEAMEKFGKSL